jgi:hypothetical protein
MSEKLLVYVNIPYASIEGSVGVAVVVVTFSFKRHHPMQALT